MHSVHHGDSDGHLPSLDVEQAYWYFHAATQGLRYSLQAELLFPENVFRKNGYDQQLLSPM
jgi:hypothetical protein